MTWDGGLLATRIVSPRSRAALLAARPRNHERQDAARGRASSRRDFDLLDEGPALVGDRLPTPSPILEHELDRVAHHLASLLEVLPLCVDLGQLGDVGVDPAVTGVLEDRIERELGHVRDDTGAATRPDGPI
jgi:hypothetical protein